jgi:hypothetical protein
MPYLLLQQGSGSGAPPGNVAPGGAGGNAGTGSLPNPYVPGQVIEPTIKAVIDNTATTPAVAGKLLVMQAIAGGGQFILSATATAAYGNRNAGIVVTSAFAVGEAAQICVDGCCLAYCTTAGTAIAAGNALVADGAGNLTYAASPAAGTCLAIALGALGASTSTPTLVPVKVGGW